MARLENRKYGEDKVLGYTVPETLWKRRSIGFEGSEHRIEGSKTSNESGKNIEGRKNAQSPNFQVFTVHDYVIEREQNGIPVLHHVIIQS